MKELAEQNETMVEAKLVILLPFLLATACVGFLATYLVLGGTSWLGIILLAAAAGMGAGIVHFAVLARSQPYQEEASFGETTNASAPESSALRDLLLKDSRTGDDESHAEHAEHWIYKK